MEARAGSSTASGVTYSALARGAQAATRSDKEKGKTTGRSERLPRPGISRSCRGVDSDSTCLQVILGPGLRFGEENYHTSCFKCTVCGAGLEGGTGVHAVDGRPACMECYEAQFQERCAVCGEQVAEGLKFRGARFHTACFTCSTCGLELGQRKGEFILTEGQQLQCKICVKTTRSVLWSYRYSWG